MTDESFPSTNDAGKDARTVFKVIITKFFGNTKNPDYGNIVEKMLRNLKTLGCSRNIEIHFLHMHIWTSLPEIPGEISEEQGNIAIVCANKQISKFFFIFNFL